MVTGQHIGPAMKRPRDIEPSLPEALEILIGKAIIGDRAHRPADLGALASAMYHVAPQKSIHPPDISEARLDASAELDVDVRFSMLPPGGARAPRPRRAASTALPRPARRSAHVGGGRPVRRRPSSTASARAAVEPRVADDPDRAPRRTQGAPRERSPPALRRQQGQDGPRPVLRRGAPPADRLARVHRPTTACATRSAASSLPIADWEEFAPFAEQAGLLREKRAEEKAVVRAADADKKRGVAKSIIAVSVVVALAGVLAVWFFKVRGTHNDDVVVAGDRAGHRRGQRRHQGQEARARAAAAAGGGGGPGYSGGTSFENVLNSNNETITMGQAQDQPDLTNAQLAAPLRHASFITGCGAPDDMKVTVRVAVKMGRAVGVTVTTNPPSGGVAACVDRSVRGLQWPVSPKTDFVTTSY